MKKLLYICKQIGTVVRSSHPVPPPARLNHFNLAVDFLEAMNKAHVRYEIVAMEVLSDHF